DRYEECGLEGLTDRARRPHRYANQLPEQMEAAIVAARREKPNWGARKIRERLLRRLPSEVKVPARSTIHAILDRHGLVTRAKRSRTRTEGTPLSDGARSNSLWCADYKGEFRLGNQRYCYPLTVTDHASRYLLLCEAMESNAENTAFTAFERLFKERGLPQAIRSDNGVPFASPNGLFNLSRLSVWWLRLGISIERIRPGHPQQNGRHERMHLTLKKEATRPAGANLLQQQAKFDAFLQELTTKDRTKLSTCSVRPRSTLRPAALIRAFRNSSTRSMTRRSSSPTADVCACIAKRSISAPAWLVRRSELKKSTTASGSSASWIMIWVISIWRKKLCSPSTIPSGQKCYLCLRYNLLPMCPVRTSVGVE